MRFGVSFLWLNIGINWNRIPSGVRVKGVDLNKQNSVWASAIGTINAKFFD